MLPSAPPYAARRHRRAGADGHFWNRSDCRPRPRASLRSPASSPLGEQRDSFSSLAPCLAAGWRAFRPFRTVCGLDDAQLGVALLSTSVGAILAMPATGWLVQKWGNPRVMRVAATAPLRVIAAAAAGPLDATVDARPVHLRHRVRSARCVDERPGGRRRRGLRAADHVDLPRRLQHRRLAGRGHRRADRGRWRRALSPSSGCRSDLAGPGRRRQPAAARRPGSRPKVCRCSRSRHGHSLVSVSSASACSSARARWPTGARSTWRTCSMRPRPSRRRAMPRHRWRWPGCALPGTR